MNAPKRLSIISERSRLLGGKGQKTKESKLKNGKKLAVPVPKVDFSRKKGPQGKKTFVSHRNHSIDGARNEIGSFRFLRRQLPAALPNFESVAGDEKVLHLRTALFCAMRWKCFVVFSIKSLH